MGEGGVWPPLLTMFIGPPKILDAPLNLAPPQIKFFAQVPPSYFGLRFLGPP